MAKNSNELEDVIESKNEKIIPLGLMYDSLVVEDEEQLRKTIDILSHNEFSQQYENAAAEAKKIAQILENKTLSPSDKKSKLKKLQEEQQSFKTRARLARHLHQQGINTKVEIRKIPDMRYLIPISHAGNKAEFEGKISSDRGKNKENYPSDVAPRFDDSHYNRLITSLEKRLEQLKSDQNTSQEMIEYYERVIAAYQSKDFEQISKLNNYVNSYDNVMAAYDIRNHTGQGVYPPNFWFKDIKVVENENVATVSIADEPVKNLRTDQKTNSNTNYNSDEWKQLIDGNKDAYFVQLMAQNLNIQRGIEIDAIKEVMGDKFPKDFDSLTPEKQEEKIVELRNNLVPTELVRYNVKMTASAKVLLDTLPPHQLVVMVEEIDKRLKDNKLSKEEKEKLQTCRDSYVGAMVTKTKNYIEGQTVVNSANAGDVYDGAMEMFALLEKEQNLQELNKEQLKTAKDKMEAAVAEYDKANNLAQIKPEDEQSLETAFDSAFNAVTSLNFDDPKAQEKYGICAEINNIQFEGSEQEQTEKKELLYDTLKLTIARNAALRGYNKNKEECNKILKQEIAEVTSTYITTLRSTEQISKLPEDASKTQVEDTIKQQNNRKTTISDKALSAFEASVVNNHVSVLNRLATKLNNRGANILNKMYDPLRQIDKTCISRFGPAYGVTKSFGKMMLRNMGAQATNQAMRIGCNVATTALGYPGVGSQIYACVYAVQAIYRLNQARKFEKQQAEAAGKKFSNTSFLLRKSPEILLSAAGTAASFFGGAIAAKGLNAAVRYGMMGAGWAISVVKGVRASRKQKQGWGESIAKAIGNATLSTTSAVISSALICGGVNHFSSYLDGANFPANENEPEGTFKHHENQIFGEELHYNQGETISGEIQHGGYAEGAVERAASTAADWQRDVPELHDNNISAIESNDTIKDFNTKNPEMAVDPNRMEMIIMLCGGQAVPADVDSHINYNQFGENIDVRGNHCCITDAWVDTYGDSLKEFCGGQPITNEDIAAIRDLHNPDGTFNAENMSERTLAVINALDHKIGAHFEVGDIESARGGSFTDGVLANAHHAAEDGKLEVAPDRNGDRYNTYSDSDSARNPDKITETTTPNDEQIFIPFTVTFDRTWGSVKGFVLNKIMGANGSYVEKDSPSQDIKHGDVNTPTDKDKTPENKNNQDIKHGDVNTPADKDKNSVGATDKKQQKTEGLAVAGQPKEKRNIFSRIFGGSDKQR